jgi:hypothetical protein
MSQGQPRFVRVTHADALEAQEAEHASEQDRDAAAERNHNERARQETFAVVDPIAPADQRWRAGIRVDERGSVRQAFSCNCGKHSHGHGTPDHPDAFASIIEPTRFEAEPPAWAKDYNARAQNDLQERAAALAARVQAARTRPGKTDRSRR